MPRHVPPRTGLVGGDASLAVVVPERRPHHLRDDVAGALHDDVVAGADLLALDVVFVVQRSPFDCDPADRHRREHRERREHSGTPHVDLDREQPRDRRGGRELEGDRPAGVVGDLAQVALQRDVVDLHDHAVDVVVDLAAALDPGGALGHHLLDRLVTSRRGVHAKALLAQPVERLPVACDLEPFAVAELVAPDVERPRGGDSRIELTDGAGGGVARVGEGRLAGGRARLVQAREAGQRQVDLAAHLDHGRHRLVTIKPAQTQGHGVDGAQVGGHVFADHAVAAGGAALEDPVAIDQRDGETVDLGFGDVAQGGLAEPVRLEQTAVATVPGQQLVFVAGVGQRKHGLQVTPLRELLERLPADPLGRRVERAQLGIGVLELLQLVQQQVVVGVADLGLVEDIVEVAVAFDLAAQLGGAAGGCRRVVCDLTAPAHDAPAMSGAPPRQRSARAAGVATVKSGVAAARAAGEKAPQSTATVVTPAAFPAATSTGASPT